MILSFKHGTPVVRVVYYFAEALQEKIERKTGKFSLRKTEENFPVDIEEAMTTPHSPSWRLMGNAFLSSNATHGNSSCLR